MFSLYVYYLVDCENPLRQETKFASAESQLSSLLFTSNFLVLLLQTGIFWLQLEPRESSEFISVKCMCAYVFPCWVGYNTLSC